MINSWKDPRMRELLSLDLRTPNPDKVLAASCPFLHFYLNYNNTAKQISVI